MVKKSDLPKKKKKRPGTEIKKRTGRKAALRQRTSGGLSAGSGHAICPEMGRGRKSFGALLFWAVWSSSMPMTCRPLMMRWPRHADQRLFC